MTKVFIWKQVAVFSEPFQILIGADELHQPQSFNAEYDKRCEHDNIFYASRRDKCSPLASWLLSRVLEINFLFEIAK